MVDFNKDGTFSAPIPNIVKILILQARANCFEALEKYNQQINKNIYAEQSILRSRLLTWFLELQAYTKRNISPEDYILIMKVIESKLTGTSKDMSNKEIMSFLYELNETTDALGVTKIDVNRKYNRADIELSNSMEGLF